MNGNHLQQSLTSWQPRPHYNLEECLSILVPVFSFQLNVQLLHQTCSFLLLVVHNAVEHLINGIQHIHTEGTFIVIFLLLWPFLGLRVEKVLTPKPLHKFHNINLELLSIHLSELFESEGPAMKTWAKTNTTLAGIHSYFSHRTRVIAVGRDDHVNIFNDPLESLV